MLTPRARTVAILASAALAAAGVALAEDAAKKPAAQPPAAAAAETAAVDLEGVLADLGRRLGAFKTLRARFEQKKYLEVFEDVVTSEGTLAIAVPDKLRWEYVRPLKSVLTVNGARAQRERTSRKGETKRTTCALEDEPVTAITVQQVFLWTRGDFAKARDGYDLALVSEKPLVVRATPRQERMRKVVATIDLTFADDRTKLTGLALTETSKARTVITFLGVEIDPVLPEALFQIVE